MLSFSLLIDVSKNDRFVLFGITTSEAFRRAELDFDVWEAMTPLSVAVGGVCRLGRASGRSNSCAFLSAVCASPHELCRSRHQCLTSMA